MKNRAGEPKTTYEDITPEFAGQILDEHFRRVASGYFRQRPVMQALVDQYASEMKNGYWLTTHQGVAFDTDENLADGQHRFMAVRQSGVTVRMAVTRGLPVAFSNGIDATVMDAIDRGRVRTVGAQLTIEGLRNGNLYAATAKAIAEIVCGTGKGLSTLQTKHVLAQNFERHLNCLLRFNGGPRLRKSYILAPLALYREYSIDRADSFTDQFVSLTNLKPGSPVVALSKWLQSCQGMRRPRTDYMRAVACCLQKFDSGESVVRVSAIETSANWIVGLTPSKARAIRLIVTGSIPTAAAIPANRTVATTRQILGNAGFRLSP